MYTELWVLCIDGGCPVVEVSGYVMISCAPVQHASIFGTKASRMTPAGVITYSQQWLCEQWEDIVCVYVCVCVCVCDSAHTNTTSSSPSFSVFLPQFNCT